MSSWSVWSECEQKHCYKERQRFCFSRNKADCPKANVYGIETEYADCPSSECPGREMVTLVICDIYTAKKTRLVSCQQVATTLPISLSCNKPVKSRMNINILYILIPLTLSQNGSMVTGLCGPRGVLVPSPVTKENTREPGFATIPSQAMAERLVLEKVLMFPLALTEDVNLVREEVIFTVFLISQHVYRVIRRILKYFN